MRIEVLVFGLEVFSLIQIVLETGCEVLEEDANRAADIRSFGEDDNWMVKTLLELFVVKYQIISLQCRNGNEYKLHTSEFKIPNPKPRHSTNEWGGDDRL